MQSILAVKTLFVLFKKQPIVFVTSEDYISLSRPLNAFSLHGNKYIRPDLLNCLPSQPNTILLITILDSCVLSRARHLPTCDYAFPSKSRVDRDYVCFLVCERDSIWLMNTKRDTRPAIDYSLIALELVGRVI